jgi:hypothetical protein
MDCNQDCAFNSIHILDDTPATIEKTGCAVFDGGINVNKNINTKELSADYIETKKIKVFESMGIQNDIKIEGSIIPIDPCNKSSLGLNTNKWSQLYLIDGHIQKINSHNINVKNIKIENQRIIVSNINITNNYQFNSEYLITLDSSIIFINIDTIPRYRYGCKIILRLPNSNINYQYHKIILNQKNNYKIEWIIPGNDKFISCENNQIYEILNINDILENAINYKWKIINYNQILKYNYDNNNHKDNDKDNDKDNNKDNNKDNDKDNDNNSHSESDADCNSESQDNNYVNCNSKLLNDLHNHRTEHKHQTENNNRTGDKHRAEHNHIIKDNHRSELNELIEKLNKKIENNETTIIKCINSTEKAFKKMCEKIDTIENEFDDLKKKIKEYDEKISILNKKVTNTEQKCKKIVKYLKLD